MRANGEEVEGLVAGGALSDTAETLELRPHVAPLYSVRLPINLSVRTLLQAHTRRGKSRVWRRRQSASKRWSDYKQDRVSWGQIGGDAAAVAAV